MAKSDPHRKISVNRTNYDVMGYVPQHDLSDDPLVTMTVKLSLLKQMTADRRVVRRVLVSAGMPEFQPVTEVHGVVEVGSAAAPVDLDAEIEVDTADFENDVDEIENMLDSTSTDIGFVTDPGEAGDGEGTAPDEPDEPPVRTRSVPARRVTAKKA